MHWLQLLVGLFGGAWLQGMLDRRHTSREARKSRRHASAEAQALRRFQNRRDAYVAASTHLERIRLILNFTEPMRVWSR